LLEKYQANSVRGTFYKTSNVSNVPLKTVRVIKTRRVLETVRDKRRRTIKNKKCNVIS
jgi:hypothetical protein